MSGSEAVDFRWGVIVYPVSQNIQSDKGDRRRTMTVTARPLLGSAAVDRRLYPLPISQFAETTDFTE